MPLFNEEPEKDRRVAAERSRVGLAEAAKFIGMMMVAVNEGWFASAHQLHVKALQSFSDAVIYGDSVHGLRS